MMLLPKQKHEIRHTSRVVSVLGFAVTDNLFMSHLREPYNYRQVPKASYLHYPYDCRDQTLLYVNCVSKSAWVDLSG